MVNGKSLSAARPLDVRKDSAFPVTLFIDPGGCASEFEAEPQRTELSRFGNPQAFRISGGGAEDYCYILSGTAMPKVARAVVNCRRVKSATVISTARFTSCSSPMIL